MTKDTDTMDDDVKMPAGDVVLMIGNEVSTFQIREDGTHTKETRSWADWWASGTVVLDQDGGVLGIKISRTWVTPDGGLVRDFEPLICSRRMVYLDEWEVEQLREKFTELHVARGRFQDAVVGARSRAMRREEEKSGS